MAAARWSTPLSPAAAAAAAGSSGRQYQHRRNETTRWTQQRREWNAMGFNPQQGRAQQAAGMCVEDVRGGGWGKDLCKQQAYAWRPHDEDVDARALCVCTHRRSVQGSGPFERAQDGCAAISWGASVVRPTFFGVWRRGALGTLRHPRYGWRQITVAVRSPLG